MEVKSCQQSADDDSLLKPQPTDKVLHSPLVSSFLKYLVHFESIGLIDLHGFLKNILMKHTLKQVNCASYDANQEGEVFITFKVSRD